VDVCYSGLISAGEKVLAPLRQIRKPITDHVAPTPYVKLQKSGDETNAAGQKYYLKGGFVQKTTPALIDAAVATVADAKLPVVQAVSMQPLGGAIKRVNPTATAFAQRDIQYNSFVVAVWQDPALGESAGSWARSAWKNIEPHTHGFYVNEFNDDSARMKTTYGVNYDRMVALKSKFDPNNLFRLNANVPPTKA
jgi:hypothetical protein